MLSYNEIKERKYIVLDDTPYEVLSSHVARKQQRKPVNATKLRNLETGSVIERTFQVNEKVEEADLEKRKIKYLYNNRGEFWFCEENDPSKRFQVDEEKIGDKAKFLKQNSLVDILVFDDKIIGISLPIKVSLKVKEAPPAVKGDTAKGGTKQVTLENGTVINTPLFIKDGDSVVINTDTGQYVERGS